MEVPKIDTIHQKPNQKPHEVVDDRFVTSDAQKKQEFNEKHGLKPPPIILHEILFSNTDHDVGGKYPDAGVYKDYPIGRPILNALAELGTEVKILACLADDQLCRDNPWLMDIGAVDGNKMFITYVDKYSIDYIDGITSFTKDYTKVNSLNYKTLNTRAATYDIFAKAGYEIIFSDAILQGGDVLFLTKTDNKKLAIVGLNTLYTNLFHFQTQGTLETGTEIPTVYEQELAKDAVKSLYEEKIQTSKNILNRKKSTIDRERLFKFLISEKNLNPDFDLSNDPEFKVPKDLQGEALKEHVGRVYSKYLDTQQTPDFQEEEAQDIIYLNNQITEKIILLTGQKEFLPPTTLQNIVAKRIVGTLSMLKKELQTDEIFPMINTEFHIDMQTAVIPYKDKDGKISFKIAVVSSKKALELTLAAHKNSKDPDEKNKLAMMIRRQVTDRLENPVNENLQTLQLNSLRAIGVKIDIVGLAFFDKVDEQYFNTMNGLGLDLTRADGTKVAGFVTASTGKPTLDIEILKEFTRLGVESTTLLPTQQTLSAGGSIRCLTGGPSVIFVNENSNAIVDSKPKQTTTK